MTADVHGSGRAYTTDDVSRPQRPHAVRWSPLNRLPWTWYMSTHRTSLQPTQRGVWLMALYALNWQTSRLRIWQTELNLWHRHGDTTPHAFRLSTPSCTAEQSYSAVTTVVTQCPGLHVNEIIYTPWTAIGLMETTDWCSTHVLWNQPPLGPSDWSHIKTSHTLGREN